MLIPEHKIDEIRERTDLVALIGRHVELKKSGRSWKGCCPFHGEKTPSFYVTPERHMYKCFGCQAGGDAISFVQRYFGKSFVDAVKDLAKDLGIDLDAAVDPAAKERQALKDATDLAAEHFKKNLWDAVVGKKARDYLESRGVDEATAKQFGLGWAPLGWQLLADKLQSHGLLGFGEQAGLVSKRKTADGYYDLFRGRLMVPIRSPEGRVIAFGGRVLEVEEGREPGPKYLNSKENRLYNKSETLYGMDLAREEIRRKKTAVLVEGYFDCIGMHVAGVKNTVALCSTALTPGHLGLLKRFDAKDLVLLLDGDDAGRKAVERLAGALLSGGASARVASLPDGEDPDTYARKVGSAAVQKLVDEAKPLTQWLFDAVLPGKDGASFEEKMGALERLRPIAAQLPVGLTRSAFFSSLAKHMGLPAAELEASLRGKQPALKPVPKPAPRPGAAAAPAARPLPDKRPDDHEAAFVAFAISDRRLLAKDTFRVQDEIAHMGLRSVLAAVQSGREKEDALYDASPSVQQALAAAAAHVPTDGSQVEHAFAKLCQKIKVRRINDQLSHIARQSAGATDLTEDIRALQAERNALLDLKRRVLGETAAEGPPSGT